MKFLRFSDPLPELVLKGEKDTTWRINDDKNLNPNDTLSLCKQDRTEFARAKIIWVKETSFGELTKEDKEGHEPFSNHQNLLDTYSNYYSQPVTDETLVKVIKFRLI